MLKHRVLKTHTELRELTIFDAPYRTHSKKRVVFDEVHWNNAIKNAVSDISVYHALMKLTSLKYLDISQHLHNVNVFVFTFLNVSIASTRTIYFRFHRLQMQNCAITWIYFTKMM